MDLARKRSAILAMVALVTVTLGTVTPALQGTPVVGASAPAPLADSYWLVASDGGVFSFGEAGFYGSMGGTPLNAPIVAMAAGPDQAGYWLVASDGGVFSFGDAKFYGSLGGTRLNAPIVGMAPTPDGGGYWLVASDGGVFSFGDAKFYGSMGGRHLNAAISGMSATTDGGGYYLVGADGGVFSFGDAAFYGSFTPGPWQGTQKVIGISLFFGAPPVPAGYYVTASNGQTASAEPGSPQGNASVSQPPSLDGPAVGSSADLFTTSAGDVASQSSQLPGLVGQRLNSPIVGIYSLLA
jgi:hypothetical protein